MILPGNRPPRDGARPNAPACGICEERRGVRRPLRRRCARLRRLGCVGVQPARRRLEDRPRTHVGTRGFPDVESHAPALALSMVRRSGAGGRAPSLLEGRACVRLGSRRGHARLHLKLPQVIVQVLVHQRRPFDRRHRPHEEVCVPRAASGASSDETVDELSMRGGLISPSAISSEAGQCASACAGVLVPQSGRFTVLGRRSAPREHTIS
jgi:hypothetical protein